MPIDFVHLHTHSDYSMLDGACKIRKLSELAKKHKMQAIALTDHGNLCGAIEFYTAMKENGIKPIIGCENYLAPGSRHERNNHHPHHKGYHQILYAKDLEGYKNLCRLSALSYHEGFYFKPRIDKESLAAHSQGLIATSSCIGGEIPAHILEGNIAKARSSLGEYLDILGKENFYLELQNHGLKEQIQVNTQLIRFSKEFQVPLIATNDIHYLEKEHAKAHEVLLCIGTQRTMQDQDRMRFPTEEFYFKTAEEMIALFQEIPEAISNTVAVAEQCNLEFDLYTANHYPVFETPDQSERKDFLRQQCYIGLKKRYNIEFSNQVSLDTLPKKKQSIIERMIYELEVISSMGFASYFLVVWDFLRFAREKAIPIGPGRGSGAGSLVAYLLHITDVDPLRYNLLFERFLNPDRVSPPDFDIDLCERRRSEVIQYVQKKYGADHVAQIGTFGTLKAKAVVKDITRALGRTFHDGLRLTKLIPNDPKMDVEKALKENPELKKLKETEAWVKEVFHYSETLEGLNRNMSIHAAGVIIGDQPLTNLVPLGKGQGYEVITHYPAAPCEALGLLKLDFLGLRTLTILQDACDILLHSKKHKLSLETIPLDNAKTYELLGQGKTIGIFQLESPGMRDLCCRFGIDRIEDIIALIALYRPGPMQFLDDFIARKKGQEKIEYDLPVMKSILGETYGIMLYQEQVMQIVQRVAGFTLAQADILRRAMGKKKVEEMKAQYEKFESGCQERRISRKKAKAIFDKIERFAGYGFNKSHSTAYAVIAYQTAYLKANFPMEFMCSNLSNEMRSADRISLLIKECKEMGIAVLPPDINHSFLHFTVDEQDIRFGLAAIKGVGDAAANTIISVRKGGEFRSLVDFCERTGNAVNRRVIESLCQCGAFDSFGLQRSQVFSMIDAAISRTQIYLKDRQQGQVNFFDLLEGPTNASSPAGIAVPDVPEWDTKKRLQLEKDMLGFYVTGHPLDEYQVTLEAYRIHNTSEIKTFPDQHGVRIGGIISTVDLRYGKKHGLPWAIFSLEDLEGNIECLAYSDRYGEFGTLIVEGNIRIIEGYIAQRDTDTNSKVIISKIVTLEEAEMTYTKIMHIRLYESQVTSDQLTKLREILQESSGNTEVLFCVVCASKEKIFIKPNEEFKITVSPELQEKIQTLLGAHSIHLKIDKKTLTHRKERREWREFKNR